MLGWLVLTFALTEAGYMRVATGAHVGGLVLGFAVAWLFWKSRCPRRGARSRESRLRLWPHSRFCPSRTCPGRAAGGYGTRRALLRLNQGRRPIEY
jgi:hypothetical protein